jgi:hypothetical protein
LKRITFIEQIRRQIYGGQPSDDADITIGLVNVWLEQGIAVAAKTNYTDNLKLDGISYVNNSFYSTFKNLTVTEDEQFVYKVELPQIPIGIGANEGISMLTFKDSDSRQISQSVIWITQNQRTFFDSMRAIPNKLLAYSEGKYVYVKSTLILTPYTANATMVSGGNSTDLQSELNVPSDYIPLIVEYLKKQLVFQRQMPKDVTNDGEDFITTT